MCLEFSTVSKPKARKNHRCDLCGMLINSGEKYHRFSGKYDDMMFVSTLHLDCERVVRAYTLEHNEDEWNEDWVFDWLREQVCMDCERYEDNNEDEEPDCTIYMYPHEGYCDKGTALGKRILGEEEKE